MLCRPARRRHRRTAALLAAVVLLAGCGGPGTAPPPQPADPALVRTAAGMLHGVVAPDHRLFADIPYAAPPVGPLRWQPPAPAAPWPGVRDATAPGPRCVQDPDGDFAGERATGEDCLTLNVWTPPVSAQRRPVMVWIHGGAFVNGSGGVYNASRLAARGDIVVVTVNYRLGTLGFLADPALGAPGRVGNYGLADQQAALRWVRDNIADFGGDPDKVTLAGESAGAMSVCDHLVAPGSAGLFDAAIISSGPCQEQATLASAQRDSLGYAAARGCADPATAARCLRALPVDKLREPVWYVHIGADRLTGPVTDSAALPRDPVRAFADGGGAHVPVLIGTNHDEFTLFTAMRYLRVGSGEFTAANYPALLDEIFGDRAADVAAHYPLDRYRGEVASAYSAAVTDGLFACVADRMGADLAAARPVYAYEFDDPSAPAPQPLRTVPFPVGAAHSLELRYLFDMGGAPALDPRQRALSDQMIDYWSSFVATGKPTAGDAPVWPERGDGPAGGPARVMSLRPDGPRVSTDFARAHQCGFWAGVHR